MVGRQVMIPTPGLGNLANSHGVASERLSRARRQSNREPDNERKADRVFHMEYLATVRRHSVKGAQPGVDQAGTRHVPRSRASRSACSTV